MKQPHDTRLPLAGMAGAAGDTNCPLEQVSSSR